MVPEINLLEEKPKKDVTFLFITAVLVVLILSSTLILLWQRDVYQVELENALTRIDDIEASKQESLEKTRELEQQRFMLGSQIDAIETTLFPSLSVMERLIDLIPEKLEVKNYQYGLGERLKLTVRSDSMEGIAEYTYSLENQEFINNLLVTNVIKENGVDKKKNKTYTADFQMEINERYLMEEGGEQ
ncbi:hypothetical protein [Sediminibacillus massiliensis]|uniref:hypothetical protein n=1 Tax=Sediminibacillus massiliensis TaxID=1926277 RepID=UPI0009888A1B|nr:hypothetical protein [Sediminibacillus massiliensis]